MLLFFQPQRDILMCMDVLKCYVYYKYEIYSQQPFVSWDLPAADIPLANLSGTAEASCSIVPLNINTFNTDM